MRTRTIALATALLAASAATADKPRQTDEQQFAALTAGLTPGTPTECLDNLQVRNGGTSLKAIGDKLIYRVNRKLLYVSDTSGGCENVARGDALVTRTSYSRLCRGDIAETFDLPARIPSGSCSFGAFTRYSAR